MYNQRAVWVAYRWEDDPAATDDEAILARLLALHVARSAVGREHVSFGDGFDP